MKALTHFTSLTLAMTLAASGQSWKVTLGDQTGNNLVSDGFGAYAAAQNITAEASLGLVNLNTSARGKAVYADRTLFNFAVRNASLNTGVADRRLQFSGIELNEGVQQPTWNDPHACLFPNAASSSAFPGCLLDFLNGYQGGLHPGLHYSSVVLQVRALDFNFLGMTVGDSKVVAVPTVWLSVYSGEDCCPPAYAGIGSMYNIALAFPAGLSGTTTIKRDGTDKWTVSVNEPVAMSVFGTDQVRTKNKPSCAIFSSAGEGAIWTKPLKFTMVWERSTP